MSEALAVARRVIEENRYLTLGTADAEGNPWVAPVWYAANHYSEFLWLSSPEARHSTNVAVRPQVALVIFDSRALPAESQAVYVDAHAAEVRGADLKPALRILSAASQEQGMPAWKVEDVVPPSRMRLYRARATESFVFGKIGGAPPGDERVRITL